MDISCRKVLTVLAMCLSFLSLKLVLCVINTSVIEYSLWSSAIILLVLAMIVVDMMVGSSPFFWTNIVYYFLSFILMVFVLFVSVIWILVERPVYTFDTRMLSP